MSFFGTNYADEFPPIDIRWTLQGTTSDLHQVKQVPVFISVPPM